MRKFPWIVLLCASIAAGVIACGPGEPGKIPGGTEQPVKPPVETALSNDTSLNVTGIGGAAVADGRATMTTAQFAAFESNADKKGECVYTLAPKASVAVSLKGSIVTFTVTAEDGTTAVKTVEITVLSNDAQFNVSAFCGKEVRDNAVILTEQEVREFVDSDNADIMKFAEVTKADGASVFAEYDEKSHAVNFVSTSADGSTQNSQQVELKVITPFGTHTRVGFGNASSVEWDYVRGVYAAKAGANATIKNFDGSVVQDRYKLSLDATFDKYAADGEIVFYSYETSNLMMRFYIRFTDATHYSVRSDYRDMSGYKNEQFLKDNVSYTNGQFFNICLINIGNELVMQYDGETLYRRVLPDMTHSEPAISTYKCGARLKNISVTTDEEEVRAAYDQALDGYDEMTYGKTLLNSSGNMNKISVGDDGTIIMNNASSNARIMAALYENGMPIGGYEYAVGGKISVSNTKTTGNNASKVEFQIYSSLQNFIKFQLFRFPTNNTFKIMPTINNSATTLNYGKVNNMMQTPESGVYEAEYVFAYDNGRIEAWLKDGSALLPDYTLVYSYESNWGYTGYAFANVQYCDILWGETKVYRNEEFDELMENLHKTDGGFSVEGSESFENGKNNTVYKIAETDTATPLLYNGEPFGGNTYVLSGTMKMSAYRDLSQASIVLKSGNKRVRYNIEYSQSAAAFQTFTVSAQDDEDWQGYRILQMPRGDNPACLNFDIVNIDGNCTFLIDGFVYHTVDGMADSVEILLGGANCNVKYSRFKVETDERKVREFAANMTEPVYVSSYENRISELHKQYADAQKGGVLLAGSSTIDSKFWSTYRENLGEEKLLYNVGIGGTRVQDWLYAYDRLIKHFEPSKVLLFVGGNNINKGDSAEYTLQLLDDLLTKIHKDFPNADIYYALIHPSPSSYGTGGYKSGHAELNQGMKDYAKTHDFVTVIDSEKELTRDGTPIAEYYRPDGMHMTTAGYEVWSAIVRRHMFPEEYTK